MLHKKTAYVFTVTLLLLSIEVKPSSKDQDESLGMLVKKWKHLEYQQSLKGRTENVLKPMAKECAVLGGWSLASTAAMHFLTEDPCCAWSACVALLNLGFTLGYSGNTLKEGCCDKPAQAKRDQEDVTAKMLKNYPFKDIEKAFGGNPSLFLAVKKRSEKME